jgi:hypothetical protein
VAPLVLALLAMVWLAGCSGQAADPLLSGQKVQDWPLHSWDGAPNEASYAVAVVDSTERTTLAETASLAVDLDRQAGIDILEITGADLAPASSMFLHIEYDPQSVSPVTVVPDLELADEALFLGLTSVPGLVTVGIAGLEGREVIGGDMVLARLQFAQEPFSAGRQASVAPSVAVDDLRFDSTNTDTLLWTYQSPGDYDQNSEVNISDIVPVGLYFGATSADANWDVSRVADGDRNGEVNVSDLTPIGLHYLKTVDSYVVKEGTSQTGPFTTVGGANVPFNTIDIPPAGGLGTFAHQLAAPVADQWYVVAPVHLGAEGSISNAAQYGDSVVLSPPTNLSSMRVDDFIRLNWTAPVAGSPDGYNAFIASDAGMSDAVQVNSSLITGTTFDVPQVFSAEESHFFGVKAVYGAEMSNYSNIDEYIASGAAPQDLAATRDGDHIQLTWDAPAVGNPDGYNAYLSTDEQLTAPFKLNSSGPIVGTDYSVPTLFPPDTEYWFFVTAVYDTIEGANSNVAHYDPGSGPDTTPPVWQQGEGIKSVAPDDTFVAVEWYQAVDADSPPVFYLLYYVEEGQDFDWNSPSDVFASGVTSHNVTGLSNDQRYKFAVRAQDSAEPANMTTNTNFLYATPMIFPPTGALGSVQSSDTGSFRMDGEEIPRIVAVNHTAELWYCVWNGADWDITNLNATLGNPDRKYHPQLVGVGDEVHILFGTQNGVFEFYGQKDADPATWTQKTVIGTGIASVYGTGFAYSPSGDYFACCYATNSTGEKVFYADRDSDGEWNTPVKVMDGNPEVWQCDIAISEFDGSQWIVAANGQADSSGDDLKFWYVTRESRAAGWEAAVNSGYGGDVMVVEIDPVIEKPVVVCAEVRDVNTLAGPVPVSDATVFTWDGANWIKTVLEEGNVVDKLLSEGSLETYLTGQDPQLVFSQTGKAVALWSNLKYINWPFDDEAELTGQWKLAERPDTLWQSPQTMLVSITSSNSVTAGEGYQHCVTCDLGVVDTGTPDYINTKYAQRNNYAVGDLYYLRNSW